MDKTLDKDTLLEIRRLKTLAVVQHGEAAANDANANAKILSSVAYLGGQPGQDGICMLCGALIPAGSQHDCGK